MLNEISRPVRLIGTACFLFAISFQSFAYRDPVTTDTGLQGRVQTSLILTALMLGFLAVYRYAGRITLSWPLICFAVYTCLGIVSSVNSFSFYISLAKGALALATLAFAVFAVSSVRYEDTVEMFYWAIVATIILGLVCAVLFPRTFPPFFFSELESDVGGWRLRLGLFKTHPLSVADVCAVAFLLGLGHKGRWSRLAQVIVFCCALATVSRGTIITLIVILIVRFVWLSSVRIKGTVIVAIGALITTAVIAGYGGTDLAKVFPSNVNEGYQDSTEDTSLDGRIPLWSYSLTIMNDHLPFGYGYDGARIKLLRVFDWAGHSHNSFIEIWLIAGPLGWVAFMVGWILTVVRNVRSPAGYVFLPIHAYLALNSFIGPNVTGGNGPGLLLLALAALAPYKTREAASLPKPRIRMMAPAPPRQTAVPV